MAGGIVLLYLRYKSLQVKILSAEQIRALDKYTIENEPVASIVLMERAAVKLTNALTDAYIRKTDIIIIICGMGNNGGDGLAIARLLIQQGFLHVTAYVVQNSVQGTNDFEANEIRLRNIGGIHYIETERQIPSIPANAVVIDALFGSGLNRPADGISAQVIRAINQSSAVVFSVDVPSGLYCDKPNSEVEAIVKADVTFTFHAPKLCFMFPANGQYVGWFVVLDIGLNKDFSNSQPTNYSYITQQTIESIIKVRGKFSHKGTYGHALVCAGSYGKIGAAVLSVGAALRSGSGLVSALVPDCGYEIIQSTCPEAMVLTNSGEEAKAKDELFNVEVKKNREHLSLGYLHYIELERFAAVGIGPGIGTDKDSVEFVQEVFKHYNKPMVIDADALNIIAEHEKIKAAIPKGSILTPHPGEFKRLVGEWSDDLDKIDKQIAFAMKHGVIVILKGAHTSVATPEGYVYFNSTGNPGMAKGGSGDVLTGVITALLAQGYTPARAAAIGVYIHGAAGDLAADVLSQTGMIASDITAHLPKAFKQFE